MTTVEDLAKLENNFGITLENALCILAGWKCDI